MSLRNVNPHKTAIQGHISKLIQCLVDIEDTTGEFLLTLPDGRVVDTKGWNDWEVSISCDIRGIRQDLQLHSGHTELVNLAA